MPQGLLGIKVSAVLSNLSALSFSVTVGLREPGLPQGLCMRKSISSLSLGRPKLFAIVSQRALSIYLLLHSNWQIKSRGPFCRNHVGCVSLFLFLPFFLSVVHFSFLDLQHLLYFCLSSALLQSPALSLNSSPSRYSHRLCR